MRSMLMPVITQVGIQFTGQHLFHGSAEHVFESFLDIQDRLDFIVFEDMGEYGCICRVAFLFCHSVSLHFCIK